MNIDLHAHFPNCPDFYHWEAFVTNQGNGYSNRSADLKLKGTNFSPKLYADFQGLPPAKQYEMYIGMCQMACLLQYARDTLGFAIPIASWYRSPAISKMVGSRSGRHETCLAVDPALSGAKLKKFLDLFNKHSGGVGTGTTQGHVDLIRQNPHARWTYD